MEVCLCFGGGKYILGFYDVEECLHVLKIIDGGPIKLLFLDPKMKLCECTHSLIK
jgi:hypothetical protein